ncbi:MAG: hypothetical protein U1E45_21965 [Geminicoccaceae bacterium]
MEIIANGFGIWLALLGGSLAIYGVLKQKDTEKHDILTFLLHSDPAPRLSKFVVAGIKLSDTIFGQSIFSLRAITISIAISLVVGVLSFAIALITSPVDVRSQILSPFIENFNHFFGIPLLISIFVGIAIDVLSVVQTRKLIQFVSFGSSGRRILTILVVDFLLSNLIFIVGSSFAGAVAHVFEVSRLLNGGYSIDFIVHNFGALNSLVKSQFWFNFSVYSQEVFEHYKNHFDPFITTAFKFNFYKDVKLITLNYPFTTMYITSLATSIWIYICVLTILAVRVFAGSIRRSRVAIRWGVSCPECALLVMRCMSGLVFVIILIASVGL